MPDALAIQMNPGFSNTEISKPVEEAIITVRTPEQQKMLDMATITADDAYQFAFRRFQAWRETYGMWRGNVVIDRLIQRQSVHLPVMKYSIKTILKDVDDPPMLSFKERSNQKQKELFYNEYWKEISRENKLRIKDLIDKKQALLYGRTWKKLNIKEGKFYFEIIDPQDITVNRYVDTSSLDSANDIHHLHIFRTLSSLSSNPLYDEKAIKSLQYKYATQKGLVTSDDHKQSLEEKNERLRDLGDIDIDNPILGEAYVELAEHYVKIFDQKLQRNIIWFIVTAGGTELLASKPLHELIGKTTDDYWYDHFPFVTWGEDPERTDFYSDGPGDILTGINKIVDSWASQLVENRTLRNLGMRYYNSDLPGFAPQSYEPEAFGHYPIPLGSKGEIDINKVIKDVEIPELSESLDEIQFMLTMAEKASGATATQQGMITKDVLLGDIKLALANAQERTKGMTSLYTDSWEEFGLKYTKLLEAAGDMIDAVRIYRKGRFTENLFSTVIEHKDWKSELGYQCEVKDLSQNASEETDILQKLNAAKAIMPNNVPLNEIYKQHVLEFARLDANEIQKVMEFEKNPPPTLPVNPLDPTGAGSTLTQGAMGGNQPPMLPAVA